MPIGACCCDASCQTRLLRSNLRRIVVGMVRGTQLCDIDTEVDTSLCVTSPALLASPKKCSSSRAHSGMPLYAPLLFARSTSAPSLPLSSGVTWQALHFSTHIILVTLVGVLHLIRQPWVNAPHVTLLCMPGSHPNICLRQHPVKVTWVKAVRPSAQVRALHARICRCALNHPAHKAVRIIAAALQSPTRPQLYHDVSLSCLAKARHALRKCWHANWQLAF